MKYLKLYENFEDIDSICKKYGIINYTINDDMSVDVDGTVYLSLSRLNPQKVGELPLKFRNVSGSFYCSYIDLTTLEGCPEHVGSNFFCNNNRFTTLEGCPKSIGGDFDFRYNEIRTFEKLPQHIGGEFYCNNTPLWELWKIFNDKEKVELFNDFGITDGEVVIMDRLCEFLEMIDKPITDKGREIYRKSLKEKGYKII